MNYCGPFSGSREGQDKGGGRVGGGWAREDKKLRSESLYSKGAFVWDIPEYEYILEFIPEYIPAILLLGAE